MGIAVTGAQAVSLARDRKPDIVLLDYHLPGYEGDELITRIKVASPRSKIIVVTSDTTDASLSKAMQAGADSYITKDLAIEDVVGAVRQAVDRLNVGTPPPPQEGALTQREVEILRLLADGKDVKSMAGSLGLSPNTVRAHLQNMYSKLDAHSQVEALAIARRRGLIA